MEKLEGGLCPAMNLKSMRMMMMMIMIHIAH